MPPRLHVDQPLAPGATVALPEAQARHAQVLRLQPGEGLVLFNGQGGEWLARVERIGRREVVLSVQAHMPADREPAVQVTVAAVVAANERFDWLVEKATELGAAAIQPLISERSVARSDDPQRAARKQQHWQRIAIAAAEQSGRTRVPAVAPLLPLAAWQAAPPEAGTRVLLRPDEGEPLGAALAARLRHAAITLVSGPEGGLSGGEEAALLAAGAVPITLGPRVLRAETAPLAALAVLVAPP